LEDKGFVEEYEEGIRLTNPRKEVYLKLRESLLSIL